MKKNPSVPNEEIEELRKKGLSYRAIADRFREKGIKVSYQAIQQRCRVLNKMKHEEETSQISDEEIYELREKGTSYTAISNYFKKMGKKISFDTVKKRCKEIYKAKREKEPITKYKPRKDSNILDDEIYELREKRLSYKAISEYFKAQGKKTNVQKIATRCKEIYRKRKTRVPKAKWKMEVVSNISDKEIYELREKGLTYQEISEYFEEQGKKIDQIKVSERCKEIYGKKGEKQPNLYLKQIKYIPFNEIFEKRERGLTYIQISEYFNNKGIEVSPTVIRVRCKKIYELLGKKEPDKIGKNKQEFNTDTINEEILRNAILKLKETKGATREQMERIARLYGINLDECQSKPNNDENDSAEER